MRRALLAGLLAVPLGAALGVPWLAVGFAAGTVARERAAGFVAGAAVLCVATIVYYAFYVAGHRSPTAVPIALAWLPACVAAGGASGLAGAAWRSGGHGTRAAAVAVLARRALPALVLTALAAVVLGAAESEVREALRGAGWRGA